MRGHVTVIFWTFLRCAGAIVGNMLARCAECGADTILYVNGVPLCLKCDYKLRKEGIDPKKPRAIAGKSKRKAASS